MIRIALADEFPIVRWGLAAALGKAEDIEVVGEAGTVDETLAMLRDVKPDVLIVDPAIPDHGRFDVLAAIRELEASPLIVVISAHADASFAARSIAAGAHGYVSKASPPQALLDAIHTVSRGERFLPAGVEEVIALGDGHPASALTARELQVMEMLGRGMTSREIAEHFGISVKTVDTHRGHVLKKLGLRNNAELARFAVKHGYVAL